MMMMEDGYNYYHHYVVKASQARVATGGSFAAKPRLPWGFRAA